MKNKISNLPLRINCEGFFTDGEGNILAKRNNNGYIIFPGGGIDKNEKIEEGMIRETLEETGAKVKNIKFLGKISIIWGDDWAKTKKQKERVKKYRGDEMNFFSGRIEEFDEKNNSSEDYWEGNKIMPISKVIKIIESIKDKDESTKEYREKQLKYLKEFLE